MQQNDFLMLPIYNTILEKYGIIGHGKLKRIHVYNEALAFAYEKSTDNNGAQNREETANSKDGPIPPETLSRWLSGKRWVSSEVLNAVMESPNNSFTRFYAFWEKNIFQNNITIPDYFDNEVIALLNKDPFGCILFPDGNVPYNGDIYSLLAEALVQSLANEYIAKETGLTSGFSEELLNVDFFCKKHGNDLRAPYIIDILLRMPDSKLMRALNSFDSKLGNAVSASVGNYVRNPKHSTPYTESDIHTPYTHPVLASRFLFLAKKHAYSGKRAVAEEQDLIYGIFQEDSGSIRQILDKTGGFERLMASVLSLPPKKATSFNL